MPPHLFNPQPVGNQKRGLTPGMIYPMVALELVFSSRVHIYRKAINMLEKLLSRITYANVAATLALVFAMTGGAYAAKR
jgi:hypothetical protein